MDESPYRKLVQSLARQARLPHHGEPSERLQAVAPVVLRRKHALPGGLYDSAFMVSDGVVTSFNGAGRQRWQVQTKSYWASPALLAALPHDPALAGSAAPILAPITPTLSGISMRARGGGGDDALLALGQEFGTLLSADGMELATFILPDAPVGPPVFGDFDHDGYTDFILHSRTQMVGMSVAPRAHRKPLSMLMGTLLLLLLGSVVVHSATISSGDKSGLSTFPLPLTLAFNQHKLLLHTVGPETRLARSAHSVATTGRKPSSSKRSLDMV